MSRRLLILFFTLASLYCFGQDKTLEFFVESGITKSPLLKDFKNQKNSNAIDSLRIIASYKPQVTATSTNTYAPTYNGWGYESAITNVGNFSQLISVNKRLVSKENLQNQYEAINLQNQTLDISGKVSEQDIRKSITSQYITAYGDQQQLNFNNEMLKLLSKEETILKTLTEKNVYRQTDYLSFLVTLKQQELAISQIKIQLQNDLATLNYLSGIYDTSFSTLSKPEVEPTIVEDVETTVFARQFKIDSLKLKNNDAFIDYTYKPKVDIYADAGHISTFQSEPYKNFGTSFGVSITMPIYDGKQKKMQHDKNAISQLIRSDYEQYFKSQYVQQIAQLVQQLQSTDQFIIQAKDQLKYSEALIDANRKLLVSGDVRMADFILAIGNYLSAKNAITQTSINRLQIINQINYWNRK